MKKGITADFSNQALKSRTAWNEVFQAQKEHKLQATVMYLAKLCFKINGETRHLNGKEHMKKIMTTKSALQKVQEESLQKDNENKNSMLPHRMNLPENSSD